MPQFWYLVPSGGREFPHPKTGELVTEVNAGWADTDRWSEDFTPEGGTLDEPSDARADWKWFEDERGR